ncbi:MAG: RNA-binding S4 domain-containing protein [Betaproteobacteria bacterium]|nr:RNA-binding S4 domain-containing protein [Betaproteobacteria bacterium]
MHATEYRITTEFIELNQLLKLCGLAASGGAGGALVVEGRVQVDGQTESRKRCKIRAGQVVQLGQHRITVLAADAAEIAARTEADAAKAARAAARLAKLPAKKQSNPNARRRRKLTPPTSKPKHNP